MPKPWFRAKRYGYGAGLPIAWQGWVAFALFLAVVLVPYAILVLVPPEHPALVVGVLTAVDVISVTVFLILCQRHTQGGWHWRWGEDS